MKVKDLYKISKGKKSPEFDFDSGLRYIQIEDLRSDDNLKFTDPKAKTVICNKSDILIAWDGANAGTIGYGLEGAIGSTIAKLSPLNGKVDSEYAGRFLQSKFNYLRDTATGATIPHISRTILENLQIPLPPLATQKKIAAILDAADAYRQKTKALIDKYDELAQSLFLDMFGDPVRNEKGYRTSTIGEACVVKGGKRVPKGESLQKNITIHPYVKAQNIKNGKVTTENLEYLTKELAKSLWRYTVEKGNVVITVVGVGIGDVGIVPQELDGANLTENANKIIAKNSCELNSIFLAHYLMSAHVQQQIIKKTMAVGVPKLALFRIQEIEILLPPIEVQTEFENRLHLIKQQKEFVLKELELSHTLFNSLLQRAFKGELE
ncbi:MAG: restriction endonuclease [Cryomorphaceae bacterium]|nr:MAG: restriction endonuclease [Cryomorphaceae bacterium]